MTQSTRNHKPLNKFYWPFFIIVMLTIVPMVASWFLYHFHEDFNLKKLNHGVLISPAIQLKDMNLIVNKQRKWQLIYMSNGCCDEQCKKTLFFLHQVRVALGKDSDRIDLVYASLQSCSQQQDTINKLCQGYGYRQLYVTEDETKQLQDKFAQTHQEIENFAIKDKIYLVDPLGNLFMYYPATTDAMGVLNDLKLLLRVSQIG